MLHCTLLHVLTLRSLITKINDNFPNFIELNGAVHKKRMEIIQRENCESMIKDNDDFRLAESLLCVTNRCPKCKNKVIIIYFFKFAI